MHKRKSVLVDSLALVSLKLCIFFPPFSILFPLFLPFLSFSAFPYPFFILSYPFSALFCLIKSSLPSVILFYPFSTFFYSFRLLCSALFRYLIFPFHILLYSSTAFIFLSLVITSIPFPYLLYIPFCTFFILCPYSVVVIILLMCLSLYSLLPECLDALPHVPEVLYHL